jgi:hypothetical protein
MFTRLDTNNGSSTYSCNELSMLLPRQCVGVEIRSRALSLSSIDNLVISGARGVCLISDRTDGKVIVVDIDNDEEEEDDDDDDDDDEDGEN